MNNTNMKTIIIVALAFFALAHANILSERRRSCNEYPYRTIGLKNRNKAFNGYFKLGCDGYALDGGKDACTEYCNTNSQLHFKSARQACIKGCTYMTCTDNWGQSRGCGVECPVWQSPTSDSDAPLLSIAPHDDGAIYGTCIDPLADRRRSCNEYPYRTIGQKNTNKRYNGYFKLGCNTFLPDGMDACTEFCNTHPQLYIKSQKQTCIKGCTYMACTKQWGQKRGCGVQCPVWRSPTSASDAPLLSIPPHDAGAIYGTCGRSGVRRNAPPPLSVGNTRLPLSAGNASSPLIKTTTTTPITTNTVNTKTTTGATTRASSPSTTTTTTAATTTTAKTTPTTPTTAAATTRPSTPSATTTAAPSAAITTTASPITYIHVQKSNLRSSAGRVRWPLVTCGAVMALLVCII